MMIVDYILLYSSPFLFIIKMSAEETFKLKKSNNVEQHPNNPIVLRTIKFHRNLWVYLPQVTTLKC